MKKEKIIFWTTTGFLFLFQGVIPALTGHTEMAKEGMRHLGYPDYFAPLLNICKVIGSLILIIPKVPTRYKEWAYAGYGFDFIFAFASIIAVDGLVAIAFAPVIAMLLLIASYITYHKLQSTK